MVSKSLCSLVHLFNLTQGHDAPDAPMLAGLAPRPLPPGQLPHTHALLFAEIPAPSSAANSWLDSHPSPLLAWESHAGRDSAVSQAQRLGRIRGSGHMLTMCDTTGHTPFEQGPQVHFTNAQLQPPPTPAHASSLATAEPPRFQ